MVEFDWVGTMRLGPQQGFPKEGTSELRPGWQEGGNNRKNGGERGAVHRLPWEYKESEEQ